MLPMIGQTGDRIRKMTILNNLTQKFGIVLTNSKVPLEEGLGLPNATITSGTYNSISRVLTLNLSDGRVVQYRDQDSTQLASVLFQAGL